MRYKRMGRNGTYRLRLPLFDGGVHAADGTAIADNEFADACNLHIRDGVLKTRRAVMFQNNHNIEEIGIVAEYHDITSQQDVICREPFEVDGELCVAMLAAIGYSSNNEGEKYHSYSRVLIVNMDGAVRKSYTIDGLSPTQSEMVLVPVDKAKYHVPFFVYHANGVYRPNGDVIEQIPKDEMYAPLVMINGTTSSIKANGVMFEGFNMLTSRYRAQFTTTVGTGSATEPLRMPTELSELDPVTVEVTTSDGIYTATMPRITEETVAFRNPDGTESTEHSLEVKKDGTVTIIHPFEKSTASNNVTVTASRINMGNTLGMPTIGVWFGGTNNRLGGTRLFLSGFGRRAGEKARVIWSDVNNPLYFPENNNMHVGDLSQRITALDKQEDMLVVFKEREMYYTTYVQGEIDEQAIAEGTNVDVTAVQAHFPLSQLSPYIGCDCPQTIVSCRNRLVWLCADGRVYTLASANQYSERNVREIGQKIRPRILSDTTVAVRKKAYAADVDGEYWLQCGRVAFTFRYDASGFVSLSSYGSSDRAAKAIAWYIHRFNGMESENTAVVSDGGDKTLVISTGDVPDEVGRNLYTHVRFIHTLSDGDCDRYGTFEYTSEGDVYLTEESKPIRSWFKTKAYAFGGTALCRIKGLWLTAKADRLQIGTEADGRETWLPVLVDSESMHTHFLPLGVKRCHRLALMVQTDKPVAITATEWIYTPFGYVK